MRRHIGLYCVALLVVIYLAQAVIGTDEKTSNAKEVGASIVEAVADSDISDIGLTNGNEVDPGYSYNGTILSASIPDYSGEPYVVVNDNIPCIDIADGSKEFETYSELDSFGRCGVAYANLSQATMPTEERGDISSVYPSGWEQEEYEIDGENIHLWNRSHLIAFCLAGENAEPRNLITGTEYMNQNVMTQFENMVADYIDETNNHVLYRVTPAFTGNNLVADGVQMEALSVDDNGEGIKYNVFVYNVEPGVDIDYATGESSLIEPAA